MNEFNATVSELIVSGVAQPADSYTGGDASWITDTGILTVGTPQTSYQQWAALFPGADLGDPANDFDDDGLSNDEERLWGLDPTNGASVGPISSPINASSGAFSYTRGNPTLSGATYSHQCSETLAANGWTAFTPVNETGDNASPVETVQVTLPAALLAKAVSSSGLSPPCATTITLTP